MPYMTAEKRAAGGHTPNTYDPHNGGPCTCDWSDPKTWTAANMAHRVLRGPDQSRYGTATTDPLGREGPGWKTGTHGLPVRVKATD